MLGAGLFAANLSTTFRLRKFGMIDGATYPIQFQARRASAARGGVVLPMAQAALVPLGHGVRLRDV